jgi:hypothetical protein
LAQAQSFPLVVQVKTHFPANEVEEQKVIKEQIVKGFIPQVQSFYPAFTQVFLQDP